MAKTRLGPAAFGVRRGGPFGPKAIPSISAHFREQTNSLVGSEPSYLLEISHPQLAIPIRVCNDVVDIVSNGNTFIACAFRVQLPDDVAQSMPRVPISIDNIGRELTQWLEASNGGRGAVVKIIQVMRDTPNVIEQSYELFLMNVHQNIMEVSGELGMDNILDVPCLAATYNPETAPAMF